MPDDGPDICINMKHYAALLADSAKLAALESFGVDNWEGYGEAMAWLDDETEEA